MELPYDGDTNDSSQYCEHGTFIGSWWGPDYLCQWCELGISVRSMQRGAVLASRQMLNKRLKKWVELIPPLMGAYETMDQPTRDALSTMLAAWAAQHERARLSHRELVRSIWNERDAA